MLELFFDLVFVFAVTQLTSVLVNELRPLGLLQVLLMFGVLWWMYGGYVWLTNTMAAAVVAPFPTFAPKSWPGALRFRLMRKSRLSQG